MEHFSLEDDFGRITEFKGARLLHDSTDLSNRDKPQWTEITIYRTEGGQYVVNRAVRYRVWHSNEDCDKTVGEDLYPAELTRDTFPCSRCVGKMTATGEYGQEDKINIEVYRTPQELITGLGSRDGSTGSLNHGRFTQALLADLSDVDKDVEAVWMRQVLK